MCTLAIFMITCILLKAFYHNCGCVHIVVKFDGENLIHIAQAVNRIDLHTLFNCVN